MRGPPLASAVADLRDRRWRYGPTCVVDQQEGLPSTTAREAHADRAARANDTELRLQLADRITSWPMFVWR
jgi:hypothetical protein